MSAPKTIEKLEDLGLTQDEAEFYANGARRVLGVPGQEDEIEVEVEKPLAQASGKIGKVDLGYKKPLNKPLAR